eukprot:3902549-Pyramimonas_sp.AAC.1
MCDVVSPGRAEGASPLVRRSCRGHCVFSERAQRPPAAGNQIQPVQGQGNRALQMSGGEGKGRQAARRRPRL